MTPVGEREKSSGARGRLLPEQSWLSLFRQLAGPRGSSNIEAETLHLAPQVRPDDQ